MAGPCITGEGAGLYGGCFVRAGSFEGDMLSSACTCGKLLQSAGNTGSSQGALEAECM